jgi:hypothetical protein
MYQNERGVAKCGRGVAKLVPNVPDLECKYFFFFYVLYSALLHLPPLKFHCVGGCWDRTQDCCVFGIGGQTLEPLG